MDALVHGDAEEEIHFYLVLFSALEQTQCLFVACDSK